MNQKPHNDLPERDTMSYRERLRKQVEEHKIDLESLSSSTRVKTEELIKKEKRFKKYKTNN